MAWVKVDLPVGKMPAMQTDARWYEGRGNSERHVASSVPYQWAKLLQRNWWNPFELLLEQRSVIRTQNNCGSELVGDLKD